MAVGTMSRDDAVRAAAEAMLDASRYALPEDTTADDFMDAALAAVDAAAPHLTADLVRERDEALAMVDEKSDMGHAAADAWQARAERAEAAIARVEALCEHADDEARRLDFIDGEGGLTTSEVRAALRGDRP